MRNFKANNHGKNDRSDRLNVVCKADDQILIDVFSIGDYAIANAGICLDREEARKLANWLDEFLYKTRKGAGE